MHFPESISVSSSSIVHIRSHILILAYTGKKLFKERASPVERSLATGIPLFFNSCLSSGNILNSQEIIVSFVYMSKCLSIKSKRMVTKYMQTLCTK